MSKEVQISFRVESQLRAEFTDAALQAHRPAAQVIREFMRAYVNEAHKRQNTVAILPENTDTSMQATLAARVESIRESHASNLIENMDMGEDAYLEMLERAREPISNEEFVRREKSLVMQQYYVAKTPATTG